MDYHHFGPILSAIDISSSNKTDAKINNRFNKKSNSNRGNKNYILRKQHKKVMNNGNMNGRRQ